MIERGHPDHHDDGEEDRVTRSLAALAIVLFLVDGGLFLVQRLRATAAVQDCVMAGRGNCAAIEAPPRRK